MYRYVDAIFAHKLLILLPLIIIVPLSTIGSVFLTRSYEVSATIWIDSSPLLSLTDSYRGYQRQNEIEANAFNEWLGTNTFVKELIERTGLANEIVQGQWPKPSRLEGAVTDLPLFGAVIQGLAFKRSSNPDVLLDQTVEQVRKSIKAEPRGDHLVKVTYKGEDWQHGMNLVADSIELFNERTIGRKAEQAKAAIDFFQSQLQEREERLQASAQTLNRFLEVRPVATSVPRAPLEEQELAEIERQHSLERTLYESALRRLEQARVSGAADLQKVQSGFRIADSPEAPTEGGLDKKKVITFTLIGLIGGLVLGLGTVIVMEWAGRTVRCGDDCLATTDVPVLATIPHLVAPRSKSGTNTRREHLVRRFVGELVAGSSNFGCKTAIVPHPAPWRTAFASFLAALPQGGKYLDVRRYGRISHRELALQERDYDRSGEKVDVDHRTGAADSQGASGLTRA